MSYDLMTTWWYKIITYNGYLSWLTIELVSFCEAWYVVGEIRKMEQIISICLIIIFCSVRYNKPFLSLFIFRESSFINHYFGLIHILLIPPTLCMPNPKLLLFPIFHSTQIDNNKTLLHKLTFFNFKL